MNKHWCRVIFGVVLPCFACGGASIFATASRSFADGTASDLRQPVCFTPPDPDLSPLQRSDAIERVSICEKAALSQRVPVVPFGQECLVAAMSWSVRDTGKFDTECGPGWGGPACTSEQLRAKSLRLTLTNNTSVVVAETMATISSTSTGFGSKSVRALCNAVFHEYPKPLRNARFEVATE